MPLKKQARAQRRLSKRGTLPSGASGTHFGRAGFAGLALTTKYANAVIAAAHASKYGASMARLEAAMAPPRAIAMTHPT